jgi:adenylate cyclase
MLSFEGIKKKRHLLSVFLIAFFSSVVVVLISTIPLIETWELKTYDARLSLASKIFKKEPRDVVLFYVDEPSLKYFKDMGISWPWPRELYPMAMEFCRAGRARAVVFDLFFSEESVYGVKDDETFAQGVKQGPPAYFVLFTSKGEGEADARLSPVLSKGTIKIEGGPARRSGLMRGAIDRLDERLAGKEFSKLLPEAKSLQSLPVPQLIDAARGFGNAQAQPDVDGVYRRIRLVERFGDTVIPAISLKVVSDITGEKVSWPAPFRFQLGDWKIPLDDKGQMMIRYYGPADTFPVYSLAEVLKSAQQIKEGRAPDLNPEIIKDKIVIIGVAAPGLYDLKPIPLARVYPGPEVHATIIQNLINHEAVVPLSPSTKFIFITAMAFIAVVGLAVIKSAWGILILIGGLTALFSGTSIALSFERIWVPMVGPLMALFFASLGMIVRNYLTEGRKKRLIKKAFSQYLSPHVVSEISNDPERIKLGGQERVLTVFFSDIADFTSISEKMTPAEIVTKLNGYLTALTGIILNHDGTLDKYIGDAVMAFWGAPLDISDHEVKAVLAAVEIQKKLTDFPNFVTRIGMHTGPVVVGNIGSEQRFNYTAIGDTVNLASRLEGLNKKFKTKIIISETTYNRARDVVAAREIGRVRVKGRAEPIGIFEPLGAKGEVAQDVLNACAIFSEGLSIFRSGDFKKACAIFERLTAGRKDPAAVYYKQLCEDYIQSPPQEFDGVITFETK